VPRWMPSLRVVVTPTPEGDRKDITVAAAVGGDSDRGPVEKDPDQAEFLKKVEEDLRKQSEEFRSSHPMPMDLLITTRRMWEKYRRELMVGRIQSQKVTCSYCLALTDDDEFWCSQCFRPVLPEGENPESKSHQDATRESHCLKLGLKPVKVWKWVSEGL
jgi:hypothetical protein